VLVELLQVDRLEDGGQIGVDDHQALPLTIVLNVLRIAERIAVAVSRDENTARNAVQVEVDDVRSPDPQDGGRGANFVMSSPLRAQGIYALLHDGADFSPQETDRLLAFVILDHVFGYLDPGAFRKAEDVSVDEGHFAL
jgi:hypothetical protein